MSEKSAFAKTGLRMTRNKRASDACPSRPRQAAATPVLPKPLAPRVVSSRSSTSTTGGVVIFSKMSCATRSPCFTGSERNTGRDAASVRSAASRKRVPLSAHTCEVQVTVVKEDDAHGASVVEVHNARADVDEVLPRQPRARGHPRVRARRNRNLQVRLHQRLAARRHNGVLRAAAGSVSACAGLLCAVPRLDKS